MSNLKVNSTMATNETESCDALISETNAENVKNPLNTEGSGVVLTKASMQNLPALRFHRICGEHIKMSPDYCTARLVIPELSGREHLTYGTHNKCLAFSSRPIAVDEKVYLCLEVVPRTVKHLVRIGLTNYDPNNIMDLEFCSGVYNCLILLPINYVDKVYNIELCVKRSGEVTCLVNDANSCHLSENFKIKGISWVVIELTHGITIAKFINCPKGNQTEMLDILSMEKPLPVITNAFAEQNYLIGNVSDLKLDSTMIKDEPISTEVPEPIINTEEVKTPLNAQGDKNSPTDVAVKDLIPLSFHKVHGRFITISNDYSTAQSTIPKHKYFSVNHEGFAFSSRPVAINEKVCLCLEIVSMIVRDVVGIGLTNCDPNNIINFKSFSREHNCLILLPIHFFEEIFTIQLCVKQSGEVTCYVKDVNMSYLFKNLNIKGSLWVVIKLTHGVTIAKFINSPKGNQTEMLDILSIEKPLPLTTNAFVKQNYLIGNVSDLKLESTMNKDEPIFTEVLEPLINTEDVKTPLNAEGNKTSPTDVAVKDLTPLRFHRVHGRLITISNDYSTAQSMIPKQNPFSVNHEGYAFSSRPVAINEKVYLKLEKVSKPCKDPFGFGFTDYDPNIVVDLLPRLCSYSTCIFGNCLKYLPNIYGVQGSTFFFVIKPSGEVCYGINDVKMGSFSEVVNVNNPLWGLIKLSMDISTVKFMNPPDFNKTVNLKFPSVPKLFQPYSTKINFESNDNQKKYTFKTPVPSSKVSSEKPTFYWSDDTPSRTIPREDLRFHSIHGKYIKLSDDKTIANCKIPLIEPYCVTHECYVFSSRPVDIDEKVHLKLEAVSNKTCNYFSFGFTNCDPNAMNRFCKSSYGIFGRHLMALPIQFCVKDNYLHFYVNKSSQIRFGVNNKEMSVCWHGVNTSSRVWAVIQLSNFVSSIRLERKKQYFLQPFINREDSSTLKTLSVESSVQSELEFKKSEAFKKHLLPSTSDTPVELIQPVSSTDVKNTRKSIDSDVIYFVQIVANQLNGIPEDKRMKCMQKILEALDTSSR